MRGDVVVVAAAEFLYLNVIEGKTELVDLKVSEGEESFVVLAELLRRRIGLVQVWRFAFELSAILQ